MRNYCIAFFLFIAFARCATQTTPNGGPVDKKPPELLASNPKNNQKNFKGEKFELYFDEYVKLKDPSEEILITPSLGKETKYLVNKRKITIIPKLKLQENTTYSIAFRESIQDMSESNPIENMRLAFSTGSEIDSLQINGNVTQYFKEGVPEKITVALYQADTFNIFNHQPTYFSKTDAKGMFTISNLKAGEYNIYAFDDKSKNLKVESKSERFGFLASKIIADTVSDKKISIPLIRVDTRPIKVINVRHTEKISKIRFNKPVDSILVKSNFIKYFIYNYGDYQDEIQFYGALKEQPKEDSIQVELQLRDSVGNKLDTVVYLKSVKIKLPKERFKLSFSEPTYDLETKMVETEGNFNKPILSINSDSLYIQIDSTTFLPITKKNIRIDTLHHLVKISVKMELKELEKDQKRETPILVVGKGAFVSIESDSIKANTQIIKVPKVDALGSLSIEVDTKEKNYIVQLLNKGELIKQLINSKKYTYKNLQPYEYKIRIIVDTNKNRKWDAGNITKKIEPEKVIIFTSIDGKTSIPVRANWEVGPLVIKF